jgi:hypothetical protein
MLAATRKSGRLLRRPTWPFALNRDSYQSQGLVAFWPLGDDRVNTTLDLVRHNHGALTNSPTWTPTSQGGACISATGSTQYVSFPQLAVNNISAGMVAAWIRVIDINNGAFILNKQHDGTGTYAAFTMSCFVDSSGSVSAGTAGALYWHGNNGVTQAGPSTTVLSDFGWHHVAVVFSTTTATFYIDGIACGSASANYSIPSDTSATNLTTLAGVFSGITDSHVLNGQMHSLGVWNKAAITATQVWGLYDPKTRWDLYYKPQRRVWFGANIHMPVWLFRA